MSKVRFCEFCGKELENGFVCDCPESVQKNAKKSWIDFLEIKFNSKLLIIPAVLIVVLVVGVLLSPKTEKVDLAQYIEETPNVKG